ncbi:HAD family hydrolase [Sphingomonas sp.]|uniref:HAD family hydrolase n=1 Tax=Sphingomonas sp. TaxID=28214 RepID=UPI001B268085|nr:HAD family hydrolase [Sphingomonas sp.]MBO9713463.1 HAD family hydrolase [Sphingomonas sp.]
MADVILPHQMPAALDRAPEVRLLSLDCFDTLLWRDTHAPRDVFAAMPGVNIPQRQWAESRARGAAAIRDRRNEVAINEIYAELLPNAGADEHAAAAAREIAAEVGHCFGFTPTVELMREAQRRGIETIIVSDTYLDKDQLRALIAATAGEDVAALIGRIFCSSTYGRSKHEGLYELVLPELGVPADQILHIGDNKKADVDGVAPFGVRTLHLKQFTEATEQRLRLECSVGGILHPGNADNLGCYQPHRAPIAFAEPNIADPVESFGFTALGPVFHGFQRWLEDEAQALKAAHGGKVHWLFLMRDGHLPMLVHQASGHQAPAHAIEISRFTSVASSFVDAAAVDSYLRNELGGTHLDVVARQLLLGAAEATQMLKGLKPGQSRPAAFLRGVHEPQRMRRILKNSAGFAERMVAHVRSLVNPARGDTLMLVDLGYNGSVQNDIEPVLRKAFGCHVAGRYLLLREQSLTGYDKRGFIGHDHYDSFSLEALCGNVAIFEQLCTAAQGSVVDYKADGTPIRKGNSIKARQSEVRDRVQAGCLRFGAAVEASMVRARAAERTDMWRLGAAAVMGRLMFLPVPKELEVVAEFEHDINLGVDNTVALFDPEIARKGLRQRGLFYMKGSERMYLPAELNGEGLSIKLSLLAQRRFGMPLKYADFVDQSISLPVIVADGQNVTTGNVTATPTHDGYYLAPIPIGDCRYSVGVQFGQLFDWVQVESASFMPVKRFLSDKQRAGADETGASPSLEGMEQVAPHLFRCVDEYSFMMVPPPARHGDEPMMLAIVFRPIAERQKAVAAAPSATAVLQSKAA